MVLYAQETKTHTVQPGETLARIAQMYGVTESELLEANPSAKDYFYTGVKLVIPNKIKDFEQKQQNDVYFSNSVNDISNLTKNSRMFGMPKVLDNYISYGPETEAWGLSSTTAVDPLRFLIVNLSAYSNLRFKNLAVEMHLGLGLKGAHVFDDALLVQASLLPYLGFSFDKASGESNSEFTYGMKANLQLGLRLLTNKKGKDVFLVGGYEVFASKFHTKYMFKAGSITLGISFVQ